MSFESEDDGLPIDRGPYVHRDPESGGPREGGIVDTRVKLREAIRHWAVGPHAQWCTTRAECPCDCGAAQEFEARETARKLVGLGEP
jgi:hypothetical protein